MLPHFFVCGVLLVQPSWDFVSFGFFGGDVLEGVPTLTTCRDSCLLRSWPGGASFFLAPGLLLGEAITQKHLENWGIPVLFLM